MAWHFNILFFNILVNGRDESWQSPNFSDDILSGKDLKVMHFQATVLNAGGAGAALGLLLFMELSLLFDHPMY